MSIGMNKFFVLVFGLLGLTCSGSVITFENNQYKGIMVVIHNSVEEDFRIVENIKSLFISASDALYKATRNRASFGEVTILVPPEWSQRDEYEQALGGSRFASADIRIDQPNPLYGNNPYTLQPGGCGDPGHYIHLTPQFVQELHGVTTEEYGDPGKTLVHEWAHLRYGVFDEYGDDDDYRTPSYYLDENNEIRPTGCMSNLKGWLEDAQYQRCHVKDGMPDENCQFYPDTNSSYEAHGSLMYMHWLPTVEGFCGDSGEIQHNSMAPNAQNLLCKGKSTWAIVSTHSDFDNSNSPPLPNMDTTPIFRILQPKKNEQGTYLLVLDVSGSMSGRRIIMLHRAASQFIQDQVPDNSKLGIVVFSSFPRVLAGMTRITNESRKLLLTVLPTKDDEGQTAIGLGLQSALQLLKDQHNTEGAVMILISDGEENIGPYISEVIDEILDAKVTINTVAFGSMASKHLEKLVRVTGGRGFFYSDDEILRSQASVLQAAFFAAASTQADVEFQPVELMNRVILFQTNEENSGSLIVDKAVGKNTRFIFTYNNTGNLHIVLTSPVNVLYSENSKEYRNDVLTKSVVFAIPSARSGKWNYNIKNIDMIKQTVGISVTAEPRDVKRQPIRIRSWISDVEFRFPDQAAEAKIFAEVKKQYVPVINAKVIAVVERPDGKHVEVQLHDTGAGADIKKDDGIYSAYFTQFNGDGRYSVAAHVVNDGQAKLRLKKNKQGAHHVMNRPVNVVDNKKAQYSFTTNDLDPPLAENWDEVHEEPVEDFERSLLAGSFRLQDWKEGDFVPPNRVIDLQVSKMSRNEQSVSLLWTSPGDDMESGRASRLEIRYHTKARVIWERFNETYKVTTQDIVEGTLIPEHSGKQQNIIIRINATGDPIDGNTFFFALRCYDDEENVAEVSNVALAYFVVEEHDSNVSIPASQITLIIVCVIVAIVLIFIFGIVIYRSQQKKQHWARKVYIK